MQPVIMFAVGFAVLALSHEAVVGILILMVTIVLSFALTRALERRGRRQARARAHELARAFADFLESRSSERELRRAIATADESTYWSVLETLGVRLPRAHWKRLARALIGNRHAASERVALRDDSPWRRVLAARRLGLLPSRASSRSLFAALEQGPGMVTFTAALGLARARDARALRWILDHPDALAGRIPAGRLAVLKAFGRGALPLLAERLGQGPLEPGLERAILDALGHARHVAATEAIVQRLGAQDLEVRVAAARALGRLRESRVAGPLIGALDDQAWPVRAQAARALGRIGAEEAVDPLAAVLTDRAWWVRRHAAYGLRKLGAPGRSALLRIAEGSPDPYAREMAREALDDSMRIQR